MTPLSDINETPQAPAEEVPPTRDSEELTMFLEQKQLFSDRSIAVAPAQLSGRTRAALWLLRIFALIVSFMVIYTFASQLH